MADNFLENQREKYEEKKKASLKKKDAEFARKVEAYRKKLLSRKDSQG